MPDPAAATRPGAVSVDVDSLVQYHRIHGIADSLAGEQAFTAGVPRFLDLFDRLGIKATFFLVSEDLGRGGNAAVAGEIRRRGHEIGNHTAHHHYDLIRRPAQEIEREVRECHDALADLCGSAPAGFRAPGYNVSQPLLDVLCSLGYPYDSSFFPCPPYYAARAAAIALYSLRGRPSRSIVGNPLHAFTGLGPRRLRCGLTELPVSAVPLLRLPLIGTTLVLWGERFLRLSLPLVRTLPMLNLEFHAVDLLDLKTDGLEPALSAQPDLRVPLERKLVLVEAALRELSRAFEFRPLRELVRSDGHVP